MLQASIQNVSLFHTYVASVLSGCCICCSCYTHMLQVYLQIFHPFKMYIVEVLHVATSQVQDAGACGGGPCGRSSPHVRGKRSGRVVRQQACGAVPTCMRINRHVARSCMRTCMACRHSSCMQHVGAGMQVQ